MIVSGTKISQLRQKNKLSQQELAERVGVSQSIISEWESDHCQPRSKFIDKIAKELGVSVSDLLELEAVVINNHTHGQNDKSVNGNGNTVYNENSKIIEDLMRTKDALIYSLQQQVQMLREKYG